MGVVVSPENQGQESVRVALLHDSQGKLLVLLPGHSLLNLAKVWSLTGRKLQPIQGVDAERFFGQEALATPAGQRKLLSLPALLDDALADKASFQVYEPHSGLTFKARPQLLSAGYQQADIALSVQDLDQLHETRSDEDAITYAVDKFTSLRIKQRLADTLDLPALPASVQKIIMLRSDPLAGVDELLPVVKIDPSLSAQVMSWAVSPYYAAPGEVNSIDEAVIRVLGFDLVVNLALGVAMGKVLKVPDDQPRGATPFWLQAVLTATLAEKLCKLMPAEKRPRPGLVYLGGLLHNFGYLVLAHLFAPQFSLLSRYIEANPHMPLEYVEKQVLHVTRAQLGSWLLDNWSLPKEVSLAVRHQSDVDYQGEGYLYANLIHLASRLLRRRGSSDGPIEELDPALLERLGLERRKCLAACSQVLDSTEELSELTGTLERAQRNRAG